MIQQWGNRVKSKNDVWYLGVANRCQAMRVGRNEEGRKWSAFVYGEWSVREYRSVNYEIRGWLGCVGFLFPSLLVERLITGKHILIKGTHRCRLDRHCGQCHIEIRLFAITCFSYLHGLSFPVVITSRLENRTASAFERTEHLLTQRA